MMITTTTTTTNTVSSIRVKLQHLHHLTNKFLSLSSFPSRNPVSISERGKLSERSIGNSNSQQSSITTSLSSMESSSSSSSSSLVLKTDLYAEIEPYSYGFLKVSDLHSIYWEQSGNPNGHPVVFLHGGPGGGTAPSNRRFFDPEFYRIILFDQRGAGKSTPHACLEDNTTWDLIDDIEKLREHLEVPEWQVFGGSWGSTLALAYSQSHPDKVTGMVLRGIFLLRKKELDWFYEGGAAAIFPDAWEPFRDLIPESERSCFINAYSKRLNADDLETQYAAARAWTKWEMMTAHLHPNEENIKRGDDDKFSLAFARIENHFFINKGFFPSDSFLLDNIEKIRHIKTTIVQCFWSCRRKLIEYLMNGGSTSRSIQMAFSYCVQQVRSYDYHHYLCLLHLPHDMRKAAFALRAFNVETARAMDVASDPRIGLMRLLWWQEVIDKIYARKVIEHPIAQALSSVVFDHKINKSWLKRSVGARISDARREDDDIPETIEELERYAEDTMSTILYTTLQAGGIKSTAADHAASHIGKASGLLLLLRSLPYHASRNHQISYIPAELASKHGLLVKQNGRKQIQMDSHDGLTDVVFEMASVANVHLQKARELARTVPTEAVPVLLPAVPAQVLLDSLRRVQFDVFDPRLAKGVLGISPVWFQLKLRWYAWRVNIKPLSPP